MMKKFVAFTLAAGLLMASGGVAIQAQGPGGWGGRGPGGGMGMRDRNSPKGRLSSLWRNLGELQKSKAALSKDQARKVVALVRPWSSRPRMTDVEAQSLYTKMSAVLTAGQRDTMKKMAVARRNAMGGPGGPGGPRGGGPGGPGGRGGWGGPGGPGGGPGMDPQRMQQMRQQMQKMQGFMRTVNPFYPPTNYKEIKSLPARMQQRFTRRYGATRAILVTLTQKAA
jgi:hypothetical protein